MLLLLLPLWGTGGGGGGSGGGPPPILPGPPPVSYTPTPQSDGVLTRLQTLLPYGWWSNPAPVRDAILGGISDILGWAWSLVTYATAQTRLPTSVGFWIDLWAYDYMGLTCQRLSNEPDATYANRVSLTVTEPRASRPAMVEAITNLTGYAPTIIEPFNGGDCGSWTAGIGSSAPYSLAAWDTAGAWGTSLWPATALMQVTMSGVGVGIAGVGGWSTGSGSSAPPSIAGWDTTGMWATQALVTGQVTQADILNCINQTKPEGVAVWVQIS